MFNEADPYVQFKIDFLRRAMPSKTAIVYGDIYMIDGGYTEKCLDLGCERALLVDTIETVAWQQRRIANRTLDFYKGDFSNAHFMHSFDETFDVGVAFEVLLHQAPLLQALHLMLEKVKHSFCIVQPMLKEQQLPNTLVYLPGNTQRDLYPMPLPNQEFKVFDPKQVNHANWLWAMTPSFLRSVLQGEGFEITYESEWKHHQLTPQWMSWGCVAKRREKNSAHWSGVRPVQGLSHFDW